MKKIIVILLVFTASCAVASAQYYSGYDRYNRGYQDYGQRDYSGGFNLFSTDRVESNLRVLFPMYFGLSTMFNDNSKVLESILYKNFYYSLELANLRFSSRRRHIETSFGIRFTFMDYALNNTDITFRKDAGGIYQPFPIIAENSKYDGSKSKIHATYVGVPFKLAYKAGRGRVYIGASADYLINGYTKYKKPAYRENANDLFKRFRATVEAGFSYGIIGVFANYGITSLFPDDWSGANSFTVGLAIGM